MKPNKNKIQISRLSLNKQTISKLDKAKLANLRGGEESKSILSLLYICNSFFDACPTQEA